MAMHADPSSQRGVSEATIGPAEILAMAYRVSKQRFDELIDEALAVLPSPFKEKLDDICIQVCDRSEDAPAYGNKRHKSLLGLYVGRARIQRHVEDSGALSDVIYLFQDELERASNNEQELREQVRITIWHEIGHHFGLNEQELRELGFG
jgi:predicted Zn-dependent protease with MMP-like domain